MSTLQPVYEPSKLGPFSIIFVHGLGGHPEATWMSDPDKPETLWPKWVGEDTGCDTWVLGYEAALSSWQEVTMALPDQGGKRRSIRLERL